MEARPPDHAIQNYAECEEECGEDGPHDPTAFDEFFHDDVGKHGDYFDVRNLADLKNDGSL